YNNQVVKLSDDGTELVRIDGFSSSYAVDVDPDTGNAWVADKTNDRVVMLSANTPNGYHTSVARIIDDSAGDNNTGLLFGDAQSGIGSLGGGGLSLDGSGDYVLIPDHADLDVQSFTVESWIRTATYSGYPTIFMRGNSTGGDEIRIYLYNATTIRVYLDDSYWSFHDSALPVTTTDNTWHHIAVIHDADADQLKCYVDGAQYGDIITTSKFLDFGGSRCLIGADFDAFNGNLGNYFNGEIDDVRLWHTARTGAEIADNMNSELTGSEAGLVGYWKLNSTPDTPYHKAVTGFHDPFDVAVDPADSSVWVADYYNDRVVKLLPSVTNGYDIGADTGFHLLASGFNDPISLSVNTADNTVWVADYNNHQAVKLDANGTELVRASGFYNPYCVSVNSTDGTVWVADYNHHQIVKLLSSVTDGYDIATDTGSHVVVSGFNLPQAVSVNSTDGTVWVSDTGNNEVVKLTGDGTEILRLDDFYSPRRMAIDQRNGSAWVADYTNDRVVKLSPGGIKLEKIYGFNNPLDVAIDTGERNRVDPPSITAATAAPDIGDCPLPVNFTVIASDSVSIARYQWDFDGDGTWDYDSASSGDASYAFETPGTYNPVLAVTDGQGLISYDASKTIYAGPTTVYATASSSDWDAPATITLDGSVKGLGPGRSVVLYEWDFEGNGLYEQIGSVNAVTTNAYQTGDTYSAVLRVTDDLGNMTSGSVTFTINKSPPTVSNSATPYSGTVPLYVNLKSSSSDPDGSIVLYEWDYDGDGVYDWFSDSVDDTVFMYTETGAFNSTVRVTDNDGLTATAGKIITVDERQDPPVASASADAVEGPASLVVNFTGSGSDPDDGNITLYEWDFDNDGTYDESSALTGSTSHTYDTPGKYYAILRVTDADGLTDTDGILIHVKAPGEPTAVANANPLSGDVPLHVNFNAAGSSDTDGSIVEYEWIFSDESIYVVDKKKVFRIENFESEEILTGLGGGYENRLSVNPADGSVWIVDQDNDRVVKLNSEGIRELEVSGFVNPHSLAVYPADGSVWVTDYDSDLVTKLFSSITDGYDISTDTGSHISVGGFKQPISVDVDIDNGSVWVADRYNHKVKKLDSGGTLLKQVSGFNYPVWTAIDQDSGAVWVADYSNHRVVRLDADTPDGYDASGDTGDYHQSLGGISGPVHVAVDPNDGTAWVS
ncbi:PKD domain-containing protein, partial [Thermodesulfobacteriota bacterium]